MNAIQIKVALIAFHLDIDMRLYNSFAYKYLHHGTINFLWLRYNVVLIHNKKVGYNQRESIKPYFKGQKNVLYAWSQNVNVNL